MEGNAVLNGMGQAQEIFNGLPDLNLVLGSIQAQQPLQHALQPQHLNFFQVELPAVIPQHHLEDFNFVPLQVPVVNPLFEGQAQNEAILDLNLAPRSPSVVAPSQQYSESTPPKDNENSESFFAANLTEGDDPILQLADPVDWQISPGRDSNYSLSVDEEIEIIEQPDNSVKGPEGPNSLEVMLAVSESSASSAPPGFNVKGKYLTTAESTQDITGHIGIGGMLAWK